jgi:hypothetical protein
MQLLIIILTQTMKMQRPIKNLYSIKTFGKMHRNRSVANSKDRREYEKMALAEKMSAEELAFAEMLSRIL